MILSQTAEYALRAIVWLAGATDEPQTTVQIASGTRVPSGYLSKVLQALGRADLVKSQRGLGGGFTLSRPPDAITALDVINAVDPVRRVERCPLDLREHRKGLCPLHKRIDEALTLVEQAFRDTTIADFDGTYDRPACISETVRYRE